MNPSDPSSPVPRGHPAEARIPPPVVMLVLGGVAWLVACFLPGLALRVPWRIPIALTLVTCGLVLNLAPKREFARAATTVNPMRVDAATALVTTGFYRYTRNPMYLGHVLLLCAWVVFLQNVVAVLAVPAYVLWVTRFQIRPEERGLHARFPEQYRAFCERVPRWL